MNDNERERLIQKIMDEDNCTYNMAINIFIQLGKVHPALKEVVDSWKNGVELPFEFNGVTMDYILKKQYGTYLEAIFTMSGLLEMPDRIESYVSMDLTWD